MHHCRMLLWIGAGISIVSVLAGWMASGGLVLAGWALVVAGVGICCVLAGLVGTIWLQRRQQMREQIPVRLIEAIQDRRLQAVHHLLASGADPNAAESDGMTALMLAAANGQLETMDALIQRGADVNARQDRDKTPLYWAASKGQLEAAKFLMDHGAWVSDPDNTRRDKTPLMCAAERGDLSMVQYLVDQGADINDQGNRSKTAFCWATASGQYAVSVYLLEQGATIRTRGSELGRMLVWAIQDGRSDLAVRLIAAGAPVNQPERPSWPKGPTVLMLAARRGDVAVVQALLAKGADVNHATEWSRDGYSGGNTALMAAAASGKAEVVKLLVEAGAQVMVRNRHGKTAGHYTKSQAAWEVLEAAGARLVSVEFEQAEEAVLESLARGDRIQAAKQYRELHSCSRKEALEFVRSLEGGAGT